MDMAPLWQVVAEAKAWLMSSAAGVQALSPDHLAMAFAAAAVAAGVSAVFSRQATPALAALLLALASSIFAAQGELAWSALAAGAAAVSASASWRDRQRARHLQDLDARLDDIDRQIRQFLDALDARTRALDFFGREDASTSRRLDVRSAAAGFENPSKPNGAVASH